MKKLTKQEQIELREALSYLHIEELKEQLEQLKLSIIGFNKKELIDRLMHYACTGEELPPIVIPQKSKAQPNESYPLDLETLMLHGAYKNDAHTRDFFKFHIGSHFNFTTSSADWLRERWLEEDPPTYGEFIEYWQDAYEQQVLNKRAPKGEWAYNRFVQEYMKGNPKKSKAEFLAAWESKRQKYVDLVKSIFTS